MFVTVVEWKRAEEVVVLLISYLALVLSIIHKHDYISLIVPK